MLSSYELLKKEVSAVLNTQDREDLLLNKKESQVVTELITALQPFEEATVLFLGFIKLLLLTISGLPQWHFICNLLNIGSDYN